MPDGPEARVVLVTGAAGVVGPSVCELLSARSARFTTLGRAGRDNGIVADLSLPDTLKIEARFDVLIHMAPLWLLPGNLERIIQAGVRRVVAFSSTSAESKRNSADASDRALAGSLLSAEERLRDDASSANVDLTLLRPTMIYGYGRDGNVMAIARVINRLGFFPIAGRGEGLRQPVHAGDLAGSALACLGERSTEGKTYNLGGGEILKYREMVCRIFTAMGRRPRIINLPAPLYRALIALAAKAGQAGGVSQGAAARMDEDLCFDNGPAEADFGYRGSPFLSDPQRDLPL